MEDRRWSRFVAAVVCILALIALAPQVARAEEGGAPVVATAVMEAATVEQPEPVKPADLSWLGEATAKVEPPAGALGGALFLGEVPTHGCPFSCGSTNCYSHCALQGYTGRCINGCCNCF
ncbi:MAG TPA: hypothetical protein VEL74_02570 [Thermoanaerobaculia bacterium]|nr:hypothetical protein [Thermoanaerobaculia bacterium]